MQGSELDEIALFRAIHASGGAQLNISDDSNLSNLSNPSNLLHGFNIAVTSAKFTADSVRS